MTTTQFYGSVRRLLTINNEYDTYLKQRATRADLTKTTAEDMAMLRKVQSEYSLFYDIPSTYKGIRLNRIFCFGSNGKHAFINGSNPINRSKLNDLVSFVMLAHADEINRYKGVRRIDHENEDTWYYVYFIVCAYVAKYFNNFMTHNAPKSNPIYNPILMCDVQQAVNKWNDTQITDCYGNPLTPTDGKPSQSKKQWLLENIEAYREAHGSTPTTIQLVRWVNDHIIVFDNGELSATPTNYKAMHKLLKRHGLLNMGGNDTPTPTEPGSEETPFDGGEGSERGESRESGQGETQTAEPTHTEAFDRMPRAEEIMSTDECIEWLSRNDIDIKKRTYSTLDELTFGEPEPVTTEDGSVALF